MPTSPPQRIHARQVVREILQLLSQPQILDTLGNRQGRLIIDWKEGHVTYCEPQTRLKIGVDLDLNEPAKD